MKKVRCRYISWYVDANVQQRMFCAKKKCFCFNLLAQKDCFFSFSMHLYLLLKVGHKILE